MWGGEESDRQGLTQGHSWPGSWSGAVYQKGTRPKAQLSQVNWISKQGFKGHCLSNKEQGKSWVIVTGHSAMTREPPVACPKLIHTRCSSVGSWWTGHSNSIGAVRCISISNSLDACPAGQMASHTTQLQHEPAPLLQVTSRPRTKPMSPKQGNGHLDPVEWWQESSGHLYSVRKGEWEKWDLNWASSNPPEVGQCLMTPLLHMNRDNLESSVWQIWQRYALSMAILHL